MNLVGKIFVVLILVMSLTFMAFSVAVYATHKNWMLAVTNPPENVSPEQPLGLQYQLQQKEEELQQIEVQRQRLEQELADMRDLKDQAIAKLEHRAASLKAENDQLVGENQRLNESLKEAIADVETKQMELADLRKQNEQLRLDVAQIIEERDNWFDEAVALKDALHEARAEWSRLKETNSKLVAQLNDMSLVLQEKGINAVAIAEGLDPPRINGLVLASRPDSYLIEVSLGTDDGLHVGHELDVFRQDKYLGRARVEKTTPDRAVAKVLRDFLEAPIQAQDRVRTRVN